MVAAICSALRPGVRGIFNIGGPPALPLSQASSRPSAAASSPVRSLTRWRA